MGQLLIDESRVVEDGRIRINYLPTTKKFMAQTTLNTAVLKYKSKENPHPERGGYL